MMREITQVIDCTNLFVPSESFEKEKYKLEVSAW